MGKLSSFFTLASGIFAVIPGLTVLISNVGVPPNASKTLFSATIESLGVLTIILLWLNRKWIQGLSVRTVSKLGIISIVLFITCLFLYIFLYGYLVFQYKISEPLFFPLWSEGKLTYWLQKFGNRSDLIENLGRDDVYRLIQESSMTPLLFTTLLMLFIYQLIFVSLTFSFGIIGIKSHTDTA
jgi:hypothetical protein